MRTAPQALTGSNSGPVSSGGKRDGLLGVEAKVVRGHDKPDSVGVGVDETVRYPATRPT
jgi:hypothetical protein